MNKNWSKDFSFKYFSKIINVAKNNFDICRICDAKLFKKTSKKKPQLILRHDIDVSLKQALIMAKMENNLNVKATYMIITNSPLYSIETKDSRRILLGILKMGHEIGLHFDIGDKNRNKEVGINLIKKEIFNALEKLENVIDQKALSISFHRPLPQFISGPLEVCGRINAYAKEFMDWYMSDSKGNWREGEPLQYLAKPKTDFLQLLIHPIWWGEKTMKPENRLQHFFEEETKNKDKEFAAKFSYNLSVSVPAVQRSGLIK